MVKLDVTHAEAWASPSADAARLSALPVVDESLYAELSRYPPSSPWIVDEDEDVFYPSSGTHRDFELMISSVIKTFHMGAGDTYELLIPEEVRPMVASVFDTLTRSAPLLLLLCCCCCCCLRFAFLTRRRRRKASQSSRGRGREPERGRPTKQPGIISRCASASKAGSGGRDGASGRKKEKSRGSGPKFEALALGMGGGLDINSEEEESDGEAAGAVKGKDAVMMPSAWGKSHARLSRREMAKVVASNKIEPRRGG